MKRFKDIKVRQKILLVVGAMLILMITISFTAYFGLNGMDQQINVIIEHSQEIEEASDIQILSNGIVMPVNDYLITADLKTCKNEYDKHIKEITDQINKIKGKSDLTTKEKDIIALIESKLRTVDKIVPQIFQITDVKVNAKGTELMLLLDKEAEELSAMVEKYHNGVAEQIKNAKKHADEEGNNSIILLIAISLVSVIVGIIFGLIIANNINRSVQKGLDFAQKLAEGDLTDRIDLDQKDELGMLGQALNLSADNIEGLISDIIVASQNLAQAVEQISSGNQNLSQRSSEQASSLEEIASTIEESTATIKQNAENSQRAKKVSEETSRLAEDGNVVVGNAVTSINDLSESSKKIGDITSVINEIAFQTNLLALNAAVEAARAGEQGRGFAVVAGEVRNLAQRSGTAAKEIGDLIKDSIERVGEATNLANKSGEALKEIVESVKTVGQINSEIAAISEEQKQGINQINTAISEMDNMTQQNASLVEETASASEEMANQAQELIGMMKKFKITESMQDNSYGKKHKELHLKAAAQENRSYKTKTKLNMGNDKMNADGKNNTVNTDNMKEALTKDGFEEF